MARITIKVGVCACARAAGAIPQKSSRAHTTVAKMRAARPRERDLVCIGNVGVNSGVMAGSPVASWFFKDNLLRRSYERKRCPTKYNRLRQYSAKRHGPACQTARPD